MPSSDSKPLDLDQFDEFVALHMGTATEHMRSLLAECRRQREEIARLRGALEQLLSAAEHLSGASVASYGSGYAIPQETRDAARAALAGGEVGQ